MNALTTLIDYLSTYFAQTIFNLSWQAGWCLLAFLVINALYQIARLALAR